MPLSNPVKADLLLLLTTLLAGAGWIFSKESLAGLTPLLFMGLRFTASGLILVAMDSRSLTRLTRAQWKTAFPVGLFFGCIMIFWVLGLHLANYISVGAFLFSLGIVIVPLLGPLFGEKPHRWVFFSLPFVVAGLACLSLDSEFVIGAGELCFLAAAFFMALFFILNGRASTRLPTLPLTAIQLLMAGVITFTASAFTETWSFDQPWSIWGWFAASVLLATTLRFSIQTRAQGMAPASHGAIIMTLEPVWAALLAVWWLGENMTLLQVSGCALIFAAMLVNRWPAVRYWMRSMRETR
jgi:drug/metabolite transporter (DMT)-like permease